LAVSPTQVAFDGRILPDALRINFTTERGGGYEEASRGNPGGLRVSEIQPTMAKAFRWIGEDCILSIHWIRF